MPDKQSRELFQLQRFLSDLFGDESYTLLQPNPPLPDAIIQLATRRIGIEITTLVVKEYLMQMDSNQEAILSEAQKIFEQQHQLPLHVAVSFNDEASWKKRDCEQVSGFLADAVSQLVLNSKALLHHQTQFDIVSEEIDHTYINRISVFYLEQLTVPCWSRLGSFWVPNAPIEEVQKIIRKKNQRVNGYVSGCDEAWLLILETGAPSSYFSNFEELQLHTFDSGFTKTMIGRVSKGELLILKTILFT
ncbi:MAG: hypothetical protein EOO55_03515 [Hymenobacter sp.]|nr:MAG: hypothetical protein EOO55_03515 [Hymenobacter sp.]